MWIIIILVIILFIISSYSYETFNGKKKDIKSEKPNQEITIDSDGLGNLLSVFISKVIRAFKKDIYKPITVHFIKKHNINSKEGYFLEKLKKCSFLSLKPRDKQKLITILPKEFFTSQGKHCSLWQLEVDYKIKFWNIMKPFLNNILTECLAPFTNTVEELPIIHLRCADVPFIKHGCYHLPYYSFYDWSLKKMKKWCEEKKITPYRRLYIMTCHNWKNKNHQKYCNIYLDDLQKYLLNTHKIYSKTLSCRDVIDDIKTLFSAPIVISGTSSFVFMSAFSSPGLYLRGREMYKNLPKVPKVPWIFPKKPLEHQYIKDYKNTKVVISQLRKNYPLTLSTGYWDILGKYNQDKSILKKTLKLNVPMVVYGNRELLDFVKDIRQNVISPTKFVYMPFLKLKSLVEEKFTFRPFEKNPYLKLDPQYCPSWQIIMIRLAKILIVDNTIEINPFGSDYFGWYDAKHIEFKNKEPPPFLWPNLDNFYQNKNRVWISKTKYACHNFHPYQSTFNDGCPIASLFLGYKYPIKRFIEKTKLIIIDSLKGKFGKVICSEQDLFQEIYLQEPNLFLDMITSNKSGKRLTGSSPYHTWFW